MPERACPGGSLLQAAVDCAQPGKSGFVHIGPGRAERFQLERNAQLALEPEPVHHASAGFVQQRHGGAARGHDCCASEQHTSKVIFR
jgi:hypothetical protein